MADDSGLLELALPGIGHWLQWRSDGSWRELNDAQRRDELDGVHVANADDWVAWSGFIQPQGRGGEWGGVSTWWLLCGEVPDDTTPTVVLEDGTRPPVHVLGRVWACEWRAAAQPVTVHVAGQQFTPPFAEPMYRRSYGWRSGRGWWRPGSAGGRGSR
ncbi:hypothetical protein [Actinoplanes sp. NPDC049118]|uniref:hypothetical protein n=1 Tax=Actinoplanes sp. NPDC049118 TaxID=3155769 RepID=UPI003410D673